jgi:hypothetical protein
VNQLRDFGCLVRDLTFVFTPAFILCSIAQELSLFAPLQNVAKINTSSRLFLLASSFALTMCVAFTVVSVNDLKDFQIQPVDANSKVPD